QRLASEVDSDERRGTGILYGNAGTLQVQLVGNARAQIILVVANSCLKTSHRISNSANGKILHVVAKGRAGVNTDGALISLRLVSGALQRLPRAFKKKSLLRIDNFRLSPRETEERRIEKVHAFEPAGGLNKFRIFPYGCLHASGFQLFFGK